MSRNTSLLLRFVLFIGLFALGMFIVYPMLQRELPVIHPRQLDLKLVDAEVLQHKGEHRILDFELVDQEGDTIRKIDTQGQVIVADFFFTTCRTICPIMTGEMARVQEEFLEEDGVVLLSHSVTPEIDSVNVLKAYAEKHGADPKRWHLMTGDRKQINNLARRSYFACLVDGDGGEYDLVHTENFVLVDTLGRLRGFYDGTDEEQVDQLIEDVKRLVD